MSAIERLYAPEQLIGQPTIEVFKAILEADENIKEMFLFPYTPGRPSEEWIVNKLFGLSREEVSLLDEVVKSLLQPEMEVGISSRVGVSVRCDAVHLSRMVLYGDIPVIDFEIPPSPANLAKIKLRLAGLSLAGQSVTWVVAESGNSYHTICTDYLLGNPYSSSLSIQSFGDWCHRVLDFDVQGCHPDATLKEWYFFHSMRQGCMVLRLTSNNTKPNRKIPIVVDWIKSEGHQRIFGPGADIF